MPRRVDQRAYASLRISGATLDPLRVTQLLMLPPDYQHRSGEPRLSRARGGTVEVRGVWQEGMWSMSTRDWVDSPRLETHLHWLLGEIEPRYAAVRQLIEDGARVDLFCYSLGATDVPPSIPNAIRERARSLGIPIEIDHYRSDG